MSLDRISNFRSTPLDLSFSVTTKVYDSLSKDDWDDTPDEAAFDFYMRRSRDFFDSFERFKKFIPTWTYLTKSEPYPHAIVEQSVVEGVSIRDIKAYEPELLE